MPAGEQQKPKVSPRRFPIRRATGPKLSPLARATAIACPTSRTNAVLAVMAGLSARSGRFRPNGRRRSRRPRVQSASRVLVPCSPARRRRRQILARRKLALCVATTAVSSCGSDRLATLARQHARMPCLPLATSPTSCAALGPARALRWFRRSRRSSTGHDASGRRWVCTPADSRAARARGARR